MRVAQQQSTPPLEGVRVVDFGHLVAGPMAAHLLGELGATVVKVQPLAGDPMKALRNPYAAVNRGKLSLAIDLKAPAAAEVLNRLVVWADVVVHNFRPRVAERLGFGREQIRRIDPTVVLLESTAYGFDGPSAGRPGVDPIFWAVGGQAWRGGGSDGSPVCNTRLGPIDCGTGTLGAFGALAALYRSRRTGEGGAVSVSLLDTSLFLMSEVTQDLNGSPVGDLTVDRHRTGFHPAEALYELADGWVAIVATTEPARQALALAIGLPALVGRLSQQWTDADHDAIRAAVRGMTREQLDMSIAGSDVIVVACSPDAKQRILDSETLVDAGLVVRSPASPGDTYVGFPVRFERSRLVGADRTKVPETGEHTDDVLRILGFTVDEIEVLCETGVVAGTKTG